MKKCLLFYFLLCVNSYFAFSQIQVAKNINIQSVMPAGDEDKLLNALDTLLLHISQGKPQLTEISSFGSAYSLDIFESLKGIENNEKEKEPHYYKPQLINLYPVANNQYFVSLAFINNNAQNSSLRAIINFIAFFGQNNITFSIPAYYLTRNWKINKTGDIIYHYPDNINMERAEQFNKSNTRIATKLGLQPEKFDFYLCDNYQDILRLLGYEYDSESAGTITDGYGPGDGIIFSIMHNEDFSHDVFHYYAWKIRKNSRNSAAEEGIAYSWGNAYYTDEQGEMITQKQLVGKFKGYLQQHPQTDLFELFSKNAFIFGDQTKVRSLLSSLICDEVERRAGITGIKELINCGSGDDNYFKIVTRYTGISASNFDIRVMDLLEKYK
jgi:hypothetical protein